MPDNIDTNIIGLAPFPTGTKPSLTLIPNKQYNFPTNILGMGVWTNPTTGQIVTINKPLGNLNSEIPNNPFNIPVLNTVNDIGKKVQDRSFWYTAIALIVGVILALIAVQGFILTETSKVIPK